MQVENQEHIIKTKVSWSKLNDKIVGLMGQREYTYLRCLESFPCLMKKGTGLAALQAACVVVLEARTCYYKRSMKLEDLQVYCYLVHLLSSSLYETNEVAKQR